MTEQLRDRLRYLKHLPITTNFEVAELDLSNLVDRETFDLFKEQIETRKKKRNRKLKDEKRREKKIQEEEARMMGYPGRMVRVESDYFISSKEQPREGEQFPAMTTEEESAGENSTQSSISFANVSLMFSRVQSVITRYCRSRDPSPQLRPSLPLPLPPAGPASGPSSRSSQPGW